jgi:hypothetical protein
MLSWPQPVLHRKARDAAEPPFVVCNLGEVPGRTAWKVLELEQVEKCCFPCRYKP